MEISQASRWVNSWQGRKELLAAGLFCALNLLVPLVVVDLFPFSRAPMFGDAPRRYCTFEVLAPDGRSLPLADFAMQRNYWGNPPGAGCGYAPPASLDRFGDVPTLDEVRAHVEGQMERFPDLHFVTVDMTITGPIDPNHVGIQSNTRFNVKNPFRGRPKK